MNIRARLSRLEARAMEAGIDPAMTRCAECGAAEGTVPQNAIIDRSGRILGPTCGRCGFPLMANGRAMGGVKAGCPVERVVLDRHPWPECERQPRA